MKIKEPNPINLELSEKVMKSYQQFDMLLIELRKKEIPEKIIEIINKEIEQVDMSFDSEKELRNQVGKAQSAILKLIEKELKLATKNYYRNTWLAIGMAAFGLPFGVVFGMSMDNMALLGIGLPLGMVIGMVIGQRMDEKAFKEGRQLDIELT